MVYLGGRILIRKRLFRSTTHITSCSTTSRGGQILGTSTGKSLSIGRRTCRCLVRRIVAERVVGAWLARNPHFTHHATWAVSPSSSRRLSQVHFFASGSLRATSASRKAAACGSANKVLSAETGTIIAIPLLPGLSSSGVSRTNLFSPQRAIGAWRG